MSLDLWDFLDADPCENRSRGAATSKAAHARAKPFKREMHQRIHDWLRSRGDGTMLEFAASVGKTPNEVSGRFTEMLASGFIRRTGAIRDGAAVYECHGDPRLGPWGKTEAMEDRR